MESPQAHNTASRVSPEYATGGEEHCMASHCTLEAKVELTQPTQIPQRNTRNRDPWTQCYEKHLSDRIVPRYPIRYSARPLVTFQRAAHPILRLQVRTCRTPNSRFLR